MGRLVSRRPADVAAAVESVLGTVSSGPKQRDQRVSYCGLGEIDRAFKVTSAYLLERGPRRAAVRWRAGDPSVNDERRRKTNMLLVPVAARSRHRRSSRPTSDIGLNDDLAADRVLPDFLQLNPKRRWRHMRKETRIEATSAAAHGSRRGSGSDRDDAATEEDAMDAAVRRSIENHGAGAAPLEGRH